MRIALIPLGAKPYHAGHDGLIRIAASECDDVIVFASTSDRKRDGEFPINGRDMHEIWKEIIEPTLPGNVEVRHAKNPIRALWEALGAESERESSDDFIIYSDPVDVAANFPERSLAKYVGFLHSEGRVTLRPVQRSETMVVSGTMMRQWLMVGDKKNFIKHLPITIESELIWNILRRARGT